MKKSAKIYKICKYGALLQTFSSLKAFINETGLSKTYSYRCLHRGALINDEYYISRKASIPKEYLGKKSKIKTSLTLENCKILEKYRFNLILSMGDCKVITHNPNPVKQEIINITKLLGW